MVEVTNYELKDLKLSFNVAMGRRNPSWTVRLNDEWVYGAEGYSYADVLKVYEALRDSIGIIARKLWNYCKCDNCALLVPSTVKTKIWYDTEEQTRESWTGNVCPECIAKYQRAGSLKK